jgi:hypothetical protein
VLKNSKAQMSIVLSVGLLAGYAASSGMLNPFQKADARPPEHPSAFDGPAGEPAPARCCADDVSKVGALLAAHNGAVQEKAADSGKRPNILVIWGDDIGYWNLSAYNRGAMGYRTPNIDRIAIPPICSAPHRPGFGPTRAESSETLLASIRASVVRSRAASFPSPRQNG